MRDWFIALNPQHTVPTMCTAAGVGIWQTCAVLTHLANLAGETVTDHDRVAMEYRQSDAYKYFAAIYAPSLGFGPEVKPLETAVNEFIDTVEPMLKHFLGGNKFIGGAAEPRVPFAPSCLRYCVLLVSPVSMHLSPSMNQRMRQTVRLRVRYDICLFLCSFLWPSSFHCILLSTPSSCLWLRIWLYLCS